MKLPGKSITFTHQRNPHVVCGQSLNTGLTFPSSGRLWLERPVGRGSCGVSFLSHTSSCFCITSPSTSAHISQACCPHSFSTPFLSSPSPLRSWSRAANYFPNFLFPKAKSNRLGQCIFPCFGQPWIFLRIIMNFRVSVRKRLPFNWFYQPHCFLETLIYVRFHLV